MSKKIKILFVAAGILLIAVAGYLLIARPKAQPIPKQTGSGSETPGFTIPPEGAPKMTVPAKEGQSFEVNNVYNHPVASLSSNGVLFKENADYEMVFYPEKASFLISIDNFDLNPAREKAEADFLQTLETTKEEACKLNVTLGTTYDISPKNSGANFGLSFCPDGKPFQ